ncbi:MAG: hypothetical protein WA709_06470 [Stellaceae bacterium]
MASRSRQHLQIHLGTAPGRINPFDQGNQDGTLACHWQLGPVLAEIRGPRDKPLLESCVRFHGKRIRPVDHHSDLPPGAAQPDRHGQDLGFVAAETPSQGATDVIRLLLARRFNATLVQGDGVPFAVLAQREGVSRSYFTRLVRLSYLAPDITQAILDGRQPRDLAAEKLLEHSRLPLAWHDQRIVLGFA